MIWGQDWSGGQQPWKCAWGLLHVLCSEEAPSMGMKLGLSSAKADTPSIEFTFGSLTGALEGELCEHQLWFSNQSLSTVDSIDWNLESRSHLVAFFGIGFLATNRRPASCTSLIWSYSGRASTLHMWGPRFNSRYHKRKKKNLPLPNSMYIAATWIVCVFGHFCTPDHTFLLKEGSLGGFMPRIQFEWLNWASLETGLEGSSEKEIKPVLSC